MPHIRDGLCLWCVLDEKGIDLREFYESGEWQNWVDWRPGEQPIPRMLNTLRREIAAIAERKGHSYGDIAAIGGCSRYTIMRFLQNKKRKRLTAPTAEAIARYLDIEPNAKAVGERFGIHPRRVSHFVVGW